MSDDHDFPGTPRINLLCVLDWGLGHAARSLALTHTLRQAGHTVHLAASGDALSFLARALPGEHIHRLPAYDVRYPSGNMPLNVARQLPRWSVTIFRERRATAALVRQLGIERILSDNRFGCFLPGVPAVFITHQLHPITHNRLVSWCYRRWLHNFTAYWVPDYPDRRLSGRLSDPRSYPNVRYLGPLSRLRPLAAAPPTPPLDVFALLSGPEPMRSHLEAILLEVLANLPGRHLIVRGIPSDEPTRQQGNVTVRDFADAPFLARQLPAARWILCRAGYSTLMDLAAVKATGKRLFVPTPGQTEQLFLARTQVQGKDGWAMWEQEQLAERLADYFAQREE